MDYKCHIFQTSRSSSKLYFKQSIQIYKNTELIHTKHYLLLFKATREAHELIEVVACLLGFFCCRSSSVCVIGEFIELSEAGLAFRYLICYWGQGNLWCVLIQDRLHYKDPTEHKIPAASIDHQAVQHKHCRSQAINRVISLMIFSKWCRYHPNIVLLVDSNISQ